jgi:hypothetical protein
MRLDDLRQLGREQGVSGVWRMPKDELVRALGGRAGARGRATAGGGRATAGGQGGGARTVSAGQTKARETKARETKARAGNTRGGEAPQSGGVRRGPNSAKSLRYAQEINSLDDRPDRKGRSLVTRNHDVIMRWAQARDGKPMTVPGTEHEGRPGVLRFDFPPHDDDNRLREVSWDEWFRTFDVRGLNFIYQEERRDGGPSNFFILENPDREAG